MTRCHLTTTTTKHFKSVPPVDNTLQFSRVCTCRMRLTITSKLKVLWQRNIRPDALPAPPKPAYSQLWNK